MNDYYLPLKIKTTDVLRKDWINPFNGDEGNLIKLFSGDYASTVLTDVFLQKFDMIGPINGVIVFHKDNFDPELGAHVDCYKSSDDSEPLLALAGVNLVLDQGVNTSAMQWFKLKDDTSTTANPIKLTNINSLYVEWSPKELDLVEEYSILEYPTLVRTNVPHTVRTGDGRRTCISLRFDSPCTTWEELYSLFDKAFNQ